jgi:phasin family protein
VNRKDSASAMSFPWNAAMIGTFLPNVELPNLLPMNALAVFQQRNNEACAAASAAAFEGVQAITRQQLKLIQQAFAFTSEGINLLASGDALEVKTAKQAELAKKAYQQAVTNARELRDLALHANMQALDFLRRRFAESMDEIKALANDQIRTAKISKRPDLVSRAYETAATDAWQLYSQAQNAGARAWESLDKRLVEGVSEMTAEPSDALHQEKRPVIKQTSAAKPKQASSAKHKPAPATKPRQANEAKPKRASEAKPKTVTTDISERQQAVLKALRSIMDKRNLVEVTKGELAKAASVPSGSLHSILVSLQKKGMIRTERQGTPKFRAIYEVLEASRRSTLH